MKFDRFDLDLDLGWSDPKISYYPIEGEKELVSNMVQLCIVEKLLIKIYSFEPKLSKKSTLPCIWQMYKKKLKIFDC